MRQLFGSPRQQMVSSPVLTFGQSSGTLRSRVGNVHFRKRGIFSVVAVSPKECEGGLFGSERFAATLFLVCGAAPVCNAFIPGQGSNMSVLATMKSRDPAGISQLPPLRGMPRLFVRFCLPSQRRNRGQRTRIARSRAKLPDSQWRRTANGRSRCLVSRR